ncbi:pyridoxamine 5'-phosphate oxidase family protein [Streptomyces sp. DW26H14]|uniref:pyridoxamine 5'-phosphate oxidase family protein n=1 Tax=Streptomyces sp. DW26H14 TaxID=3435395 RepID=UPI00403D6A27
MTEHARGDTYRDHAPSGRQRGDLGRRTAGRREQLGISREQVAERTGSTIGYVRYIEEQAGMPGISFLLRLADALETTVPALAGAGECRPPGRATASRRAELVVLSPRECRTLLSTHGVGRVSVHTGQGPAIIPVNYLFTGEVLAYRTRPAGVADLSEGQEVAFETDHVDDVWRQGWSVNVAGTARRVGRSEARSLDERAYTLPWAGEGRRHWVCVVPTRITGRRVEIT